MRFSSWTITFFATCVCSASIAGESSGDEASETPAKRFVGIELGPGILSAIQPNVRIADWSQDEIDAYYEVLSFARKTPYSDQKKRAESNLTAEIDRFRDDVKAEYQKRVDQYDQLAAQNPQRAGNYERLKKAASRRLKRQISEFADEPKKFPLMARMVKSMIEDKPSRFHGRLITLTGQIRKLISYDAHPNESGVERLYEAWMFTRDSGMLQSKNRKSDADGARSPRKTLGKIPVVIVFTQKPEGMPEGEKILEAATVTGYVFRVHRYADLRDTLPPAPMLLASRIEWHPRPPQEPTPTWMYAAVFAAIGGLLVVVFLVARRDKTSRLRRRENTLDETPPDFSESPSV